MIKLRPNSKRGFALIVVMGICTIMALGVALNSMPAINEIIYSRKKVDSIKIMQLAETGLERAVYRINKYKDSGGFDNFEFRLSDETPASDSITDITVTIEDGEQEDHYKVTSSVTVNTGHLGDTTTKTIEATVMWRPPSKVFDHAYFINNWGWWFASSRNPASINGSVRSNGKFSVSGKPTIEGEIYAAMDIVDRNGNPVDSRDVGGLAGTEVDGNLIYQHPFSKKEKMPNLSDLSEYEELSIGSIVINSVTIVDGVYGDDLAENQSIYLEGTDDNPIQVNGPVTIRNDVILKGKITGQGTIYSGRNIYIAGDLEYDNPPDSPRPESRDPYIVDQWVNNNQDQDIVGVVAVENILLGDYNTWSSYTWRELKKKGSEDVGRDGILAIKPRDRDEYENNGTFEEEYEDLDEDGEFDGYYTNEDIAIADPISEFGNLPESFDVIEGTFSDLADKSITKVEGIFFTNHAFAGRMSSEKAKTGLGGSPNEITINGTIVSKDESIIYEGDFYMNYDERINSRYRGDNPDWLIDLGLPPSHDAEVIYWSED